MVVHMAHLELLEQGIGIPDPIEKSPPAELII